ncbi:MAG: hypothetical protein AB7S36_08460 [Planctomycetota bacterium]
MAYTPGSPGGLLDGTMTCDSLYLLRQQIRDRRNLLAFAAAVRRLQHKVYSGMCGDHAGKTTGSRE